jgi:hypothetical protein
MAASFPNAKKTFSAVVNGVTKLVAALFNTPYDEVEAIETFLGATGGGAQAYCESLTNMLFNYRRGCRVQYKSAADLYVRAGEIMITDASGNRRLRRNASDTTVTWGDIDTGAEEASTVYYVYAVADASATAFTIKISKSATTPTGCTFYKLIGIFYNDASSNIQEVGSLNRDAGELDNWVTKANNTVYQALTDGFVIALTSGVIGDMQVVTDSSNPPTTTRGYFAPDDFTGSVCVPVRKGDYWKATSATTVYWLGKS